MKKTISLVITVFLCISCISHTKRQKALQGSINQKTNERKSRQGHLYAEQELDSNQVMWQLWTQSPFHYHMDSGLYAQQGILRLQAKSVNKRKKHQEYQASNHLYTDSLEMQIDQKESLDRKISSSRYLLTIIGLVIVASIIWVIEKMRKN